MPDFFYVFFLENLCGNLFCLSFSLVWGIYMNITELLALSFRSKVFFLWHFRVVHFCRIFFFFFRNTYTLCNFSVSAGYGFIFYEYTRGFKFLCDMWVVVVSGRIQCVCIISVFFSFSTAKALAFKCVKDVESYMRNYLHIYLWEIFVLVWSGYMIEEHNTISLRWYYTTSILRLYLWNWF